MGQVRAPAGVGARADHARGWLRRVLLFVVVESIIGAASTSRGGTALPRPPYSNCSIGFRLLF
jgi:hypothetical protein